MNAQEAGHRCHPNQNQHLLLAVQVSKPLSKAIQKAGVVRRLLLWILDARQSPQDRQKTDSVQEEVSCHTHQSHCITAQCGPQNSGHVELR
jgi:hypothetical protein